MCSLDQLVPAYAINSQPHVFTYTATLQQGHLYDVFTDRCSSVGLESLNVLLLYHG